MEAVKRWWLPVFGGGGQGLIEDRGFLGQWNYSALFYNGGYK